MGRSGISYLHHPGHCGDIFYHVTREKIKRYISGEEFPPQATGACSFLFFNETYRCKQQRRTAASCSFQVSKKKSHVWAGEKTLEAVDV